MNNFFDIGFEGDGGGTSFSNIDAGWSNTPAILNRGECAFDGGEELSKILRSGDGSSENSPTLVCLVRPRTIRVHGIGGLVHWNLNIEYWNYFL